MAEIIPAILAESEADFERKLRLVEGACETVHVDIMDGEFVPHMTWADVERIAALQTTVKYEIHLMVKNPLPIIEAWRTNVPGTLRAIVHAEIERPLAELCDIIRRKYGLESGVAINPETSFDVAHHAIASMDQVLVMGVSPGRSGQPMHEITEAKVRMIHAEHPHLTIGVDGGVNSENAACLIAAGASRLACASSIFAATDPLAALAALKNL